MDVERIQKINNLALELMKQGLAENREDAVNQAEKIFRSQDTGGYDSMKETMVNTKTESIDNSNETNEESKNVSLHPDKVKEILEQNTKFIVSKFTEFQQKISTIENEIESLKSHMRSHRVPTVSEILAQKKLKEDQEEQMRNANNPSNMNSGNNSSNQEAPQSTANHPRSGNYKDADVSIEKFFYMGNK